MLHEEGVDHASDVGGEEFALLGVAFFNALGALDLAALEAEGNDVVGFALAVFLDDVFAFEDGADGGGVGGGSADTKVFELLDEAGLGIARRVLGVVLDGVAAFHDHEGAFGEAREHGGGLLARVFVVSALEVDFEEAVELDLLAGAAESHIGAGYENFDFGLLDFGVGHLAGYGAFPDEFVEAALGALDVEALDAHVGGADGLVGLLGAFGLGLVAAGLDVFGTVFGGDFLLGHAQGEVAEVHAVGTHVGDVSAFVQLLCHLHGSGHAEAKLAAGLLLEGAGGEGSGGGALGGLGLDFVDFEVAGVRAPIQCPRCRRDAPVVRAL